MIVQPVTYVCRGLDVQSKSRFGRPIRDLVWILSKIVQSKSRIGHPNRDLDWMVLESVQSKSRIGRPIRDKPGRPSNPSHGLDVQSVTGLDDRPIRDIRMSRFGHRPIRSGLDNRTYMLAGVLNPPEL